MGDEENAHTQEATVRFPVSIVEEAAFDVKTLFSPRRICRTGCAPSTHGAAETALA
ncbi:MAG: hypothetical protein R3F54_29495 [Alphaproteobacteria bacterium]